MNFTPNNSDIYNGISVRNYKQFKIADIEIRKLSNKYGNFDLLSNTPENVEKYTLLYSRITETLFVSIVFQALAVEAYVNFIAVNLYGENDFFGSFEMKGTEAKLRKIFSEKIRSDFLKDVDISNKVKELFDLRDEIVHFKSKQVDLGAMEQNPDIYNPFEFIDRHYNGIENIIDTYEALKTLITKLHGVDITVEQSSALQEALAKQISEMFGKLF